MHSKRPMLPNLLLTRIREYFLAYLLFLNDRRPGNATGSKCVDWWV
jgi:hypothetical protein